MIAALRLFLVLLMLVAPASADLIAPLEGPAVPNGFSAEAMMAADSTLGLAQVSVVAETDGTIAFWAYISGPSNLADLIWPNHCAACTPVDLAPLNAGWRLTETRRCDGTQGAILLPWAIEGAQVYVTRNGGEEAYFLPAGQSGVALPMEFLLSGTPPFTSVALRYLRSGVDHIIGGADHLALIVCLFFLVRGRVLILAVTAFTLGHSVSLVLATADVLRVPIVPVEACIALSIVFLARQAVLGQDLQRRDLLPLVGIGMLHGLGFAEMLTQFGLPSDQFGLALLSFNIGIELGQIAFLAVLFAGAWSIRKTLPMATGFGRSLGGAATGVTAAYWTLERLAMLS